MPAKPKISTSELLVGNYSKAQVKLKPTDKQILRDTMKKLEGRELFPQAVERVKEMVNGPQHYGGVDNPYEVIKVCEAWGLDKDAYLFNVAKYIARAGKKDPQKELEDLKKAAFYLNRKIENLQK
jgi:hypothetical protein